MSRTFLVHYKLDSGEELGVSMTKPCHTGATVVFGTTEYEIVQGANEAHFTMRGPAVVVRVRKII